METALEKLAILAGKGDLPREIIKACEKSGRPYCVVAFEHNTPPELVDGVEHIWARLGGLGSMFEALRERGALLMVMAGRIERPKLSSLMPDAKSAKLLAKLGASLFAGDDRLLKTITAFLEEEGFRIIGADALLDDALAPQGVLGKHQPSVKDYEDMEKAYKIAKLIGQYDIGQAVMVQQGHVLGVEALEGTDALIARCAELRPEGTGGVLVKAKKPAQERRADLPTIGPGTIAKVAQAGFTGIGIEAKHSLILNKHETIAAADAAGIFLFGLRGETA